MATIGSLWGQLFIGVRHAQLPILQRDRGNDYCLYLREGLGRTEQFADHLRKSRNSDSVRLTPALFWMARRFIPLSSTSYNSPPGLTMSPIRNTPTRRPGLGLRPQTMALEKQWLSIPTHRNRSTAGINPPGTDLRTPRLSAQLLRTAWRPLTRTTTVRCSQDRPTHLRSRCDLLLREPRQQVWRRMHIRTGRRPGRPNSTGQTDGRWEQFILPALRRPSTAISISRGAIRIIRGDTDRIDHAAVGRSGILSDGGWCAIRDIPSL